MGGFADSNQQGAPDKLLVDIAEYVLNYRIESSEAFETAHYCLMDSIACMSLATQHPECHKLLGPVVPGTTVPNGVAVPCTSFVLDPIKAAFDIGTLVRWLDFNDTWLAAEFGHPSDNLGAILAALHMVNVKRTESGEEPVTMLDVYEAMIKAHEIQGILALKNSFNRVGLDHVILVKVASAAVSTKLLGGSRQDIINATSQAWLDGHSLRTYRHAPNTGSRKSWAAGDATSRALKLALFTLKGEMGYATALTAPKWGFQDVLFKSQEVVKELDFESYVMENILFKISFPAEFHAQTAAEAAMELREMLGDRLDSIQKIVIHTQESGVRIISKTGPLRNFADRDHCLQYIVAVALIYGELTAQHYQDEIAHNPLIDALREKMEVHEDTRFSQEYLDPNKRSIANRIELQLNDGSTLGPVEVEYPVGHRRRRSEGIPLLVRKFEAALPTCFSTRKRDNILQFFGSYETTKSKRLSDLLNLLSLNDLGIPN